MNAQEVRALIARKSESIQHTCYQETQHREDDLKICVALELLAEILERFAEARDGLGKEESGTKWTKLGVQVLFLDFIEKGVRHPCDVG